MATRTIANGGGNWSSTGTWVEGAVPNSGDDVVATTTSGSVTINVAASCRSINLTGYTATLTASYANSLSVGDGTAGTGSVAVLFPGSGWTLSGNLRLFFVSTSAAQQTVDVGGKQPYDVYFAGAGGSWKLTGALAVLNEWSLTGGTVDTDGYAISGQSFACGFGVSTARSLNLGTSTCTFTGGSSAFRVKTPDLISFIATASTINLTGANANFLGGGQSYGNVNMTGSGTATVNGANTFSAFTRSYDAACGLQFEKGTTQTFTGAVTIVGSSGKLITITSSTAGTAATLSKASGIVSCDYLSLKDSTAAGGAGWYAGHSSTNVSGNTGWVFAGYFFATGTLTGAGSLTGTATRTARLSGTLSAAGSVAATAVRTVRVTGTLSASGAVSGAANRRTFATGTLSGSATPAATARQTHKPSATLSASGTLSADAVVEGGATTYFATGTLTGTGSLTGTARLTHRITATLSGTGSLTGTPTRIAIVTGLLAGTGSLTGTARLTHRITATLSGTGSLAGAPTRIAIVTGSLTGIGSLTGSARQTHKPQGTLTGTGLITAAVVRTAYATATLSGEGTLDATWGIYARRATLTLSTASIAAQLATRATSVGVDTHIIGTDVETSAPLVGVGTGAIEIELEDG